MAHVPLLHMITVCESERERESVGAGRLSISNECIVTSYLPLPFLLSRQEKTLPGSFSSGSGAGGARAGRRSGVKHVKRTE